MKINLEDLNNKIEKMKLIPRLIQNDYNKYIKNIKLLEKLKKDYKDIKIIYSHEKQKEKIYE